MLMHITTKDIERASNERLDPWAVSDGLLYELCRQYPDHQDAKGVTAKMLLIGRAYAATAERGRSGGSTAESSGDEFYVRDLPRALRISGVDAQLVPAWNSGDYGSECPAGRAGALSADGGP